MKQNQFIFACLIIFVLSVSISSCSKDDYSSPLKGKTINDMTFESSQSSTSVVIGDADMGGFSVASSDMWCHATLQGNNVIVDVLANDTYVERYATITITDSGDNTSISFKVIQKQNNAILIDGSAYTIPEEGGEVSINIQSNVRYSVDIPSNVDWLTISGSSTRALESSTIILKASRNDSGDERETTVKLSDSTSGIASQFTIKQGLTPNVSIDIEEYEADELGGDFEIAVNSNISLDLNSSDDWISSIGIIEGDGFDFVQKFRVASLPGDVKSRTAKVIFTDKSGKWNIEKYVTVKQTKKLIIQDNDVRILIGKKHLLSVINNTGSSLSWESSDTSVAVVNSNGEVTANGVGSATITITSDDGKYSDQCTIVVQDISDFVTARAGGGAVMVINGLVQYGSSLSWIFTNNSIETVKLLSMQLVDGANGYEGNIMSIDTDVPAESSVGYSTTIGLLGIHAPVTCRFRYEYNGKEYMTTAEYNL